MENTQTQYNLDSAVKDAVKIKEEMVKNVQEMGPAYAVRWAEKALKAEANHYVANEVQGLLDAGYTLEAVADHLLKKTVANLSYLIPSNSDIAFDIYKAQAYGKWYECAAADVRYLNR